jgi:hypothetical protein
MLTKDTRVMLDGVDVTKCIENHVTSTIGPEKERALFYLDRRLRALAELTVGHEGMAEMGLSYESRSIHQAAIDKKNEDNQHEREALQWLRDQAMEKL